MRSDYDGPFFFCPLIYNFNLSLLVWPCIIVMGSCAQLITSLFLSRLSLFSAWTSFTAATTDELATSLDKKKWLMGFVSEC
jgi:hypothetical protein